MQFYCISACYITPGPRLEVRCRNTVSKHVTANAVEVEAKTLRRNPRRNSERGAVCRHSADQNGGGRSGGDGPAACNPVDREGTETGAASLSFATGIHLPRKAEPFPRKAEPFLEN